MYSQTHNVQHKISYSVAAPSLNSNLQTPLQRNIAYEDTSALTTREHEKSQAMTNPAEPTYEIIPLVSNTQTNDRDDYNRLNREITQQ
jgi:hypothetical protein